MGTLACAMLLKMSILKMSSNTEIREKGECAAVRAVGQGLWFQRDLSSRSTAYTVPRGVGINNVFFAIIFCEQSPHEGELLLTMKLTRG